MTETLPTETTQQQYNIFYDKNIAILEQKHPHIFNKVKAYEKGNITV